MLEQPSFGRRLRDLRVQRGLTQTALAGVGMSTGYLSRLESGARPPTARAVSYLAKRLGITVAELEEAKASASLAQALADAASATTDEPVEALAGIVAVNDGQDPTLRWQALWMLARLNKQRAKLSEELSFLWQLVALGDQLARPELRVRSRTQLARCLHSAGDIEQATKFADEAFRIARDGRLSVNDVGGALLVLVSAEAEAGRLPDARAHADQLCELVSSAQGTIVVEALWTAATVRVRQGDYAAAQVLLEQAVEIMDSRTDLTLWMRLRLAATSLYLRVDPPRTDAARQRLREAESAVGLVDAPRYEQELMTLQAHLAFCEGRVDDARRLCEELKGDDLRLAFRDQIRLDVLHSRLLIISGQADEGIHNLQALAQQARDALHVDLAAEIWRILAETLASYRPGH